MEALVPCLLRQLAETYNAERAFVVEPEGQKQRVIASTTIDGDQVPEAADRVPAALLQAARLSDATVFTPATEDLPTAISQEFAALGRQGALLLRLRVTSGKPTFVFLENRFCPLAEDEGSTAAAIVETLRLSLCISDLQKLLTSQAAELEKAEALLAETREPKVVPSVPAGRKRIATSTCFKGDYSAIVTCSPRMYAIFKVIDKVAHTSAPVLITGDSGTGKELVARAIHDNSPRAGKPFIPENCAALTETLLESELFGYVKGAFTGASAPRKGLFELASGGTLFLDEVGEMSPGMQKKLLRVLQEGVIRPVGGKEFIPVDVRIISATNRDLAQAFQQESFREDLFYRLNVITLELPPLRDRVEDIPLLLEHFLSELAGEDGEPNKISHEALAVLKSYRWPGNVRQLQNEAQRLHALSGQTIEVEDLSAKIRTTSETKSGFSFSDLELLPLKHAMESFEREFLRRALKRFGGNKTKVAKGLGVPKTSLYNKLQKHNL